MVGTKPGPDSALVASVLTRIGSQAHQFLVVNDNPTRLTLRLHRLAELVAEIVTEHTNSLRAELDAANDAVTELIAQHEDALRNAGRTS